MYIVYVTCIHCIIIFSVQVGEVFAGRLQEEEDEEDDNTAEMSCYCTLVRKINAHANTLGKHGRFQLLICLCARC